MATTSELLQALNEGSAANTAAINTLTGQMAGTAASGLLRMLSCVPSTRYETAFRTDESGAVASGTGFTAPANGYISFSYSSFAKAYGYAIFALYPPGSSTSIMSFKFPKVAIGSTTATFPVWKGFRVVATFTDGDSIAGSGANVGVRPSGNIFIYAKEA